MPCPTLQKDIMAVALKLLLLGLRVILLMTVIVNGMPVGIRAEMKKEIFSAFSSLILYRFLTQCILYTLCQCDN